MYSKNETIAAISTPPGTGGIALIRVSGSSAIEIVDKIFQGIVKLKEAESHKAQLGKIVVDNQNKFKKEITPKNESRTNFLDEVIVTVFRAPKSYTKEDVVEISCHGSPFLSKKIIESLIRQGARLADAGEFTLRAFLNGRLDLAQAEAVADIIRAKTEISLKTALSQFQGILSQRVRQLRENLIDVCSLFELELDFAEEDVEFAEKIDVKNKIKESITDIEIILGTFEKGKILREGAKLVIVGKPNVGKSSLMNELLNEERAIVTDTPGTTRDTLEEQINLRGVLFRVVDTAGLHDSQDKVEKEGVTRTLKQVKQADLIIILFDASQKLDSLDTELINNILSLKKESNNGSDRFIVVINKIDLPKKITRDDINKMLGKYPILEISAKYHQGLQKLEDILVKKALGEFRIERVETLISNIRHKQALEKANASLILALTSLERRMSPEFIVLDLRDALQFLGEIIGEVTTEDILGNIFSNFCIGK